MSEPDPERLFGRWRVLWHVLHLGHSVRVNRSITRPMGDTSRGWLYVCECGGVWAR